MSGWISGGGAQRKRARQAGATGAAFHGEFWFCWTPKSSVDEISLHLTRLTLCQ